jgi:hypothetical protein
MAEGELLLTILKSMLKSWSRIILMQPDHKAMLFWRQP